MKKLLVFAFAVFITATSFAQTQEELKASEERLAKIEKIVTPPKSSGMPTVDGLAVNCGEIAANAVQITPVLRNMYYRSIGKNNDGVIDVTVKKPTLAEATELSSRIAAQALLIKNAVEMSTHAAEEITTVKNPLKLLGITSCLKYSKNVLAITGAESLFQVKAIAEIIKTLSTGDNL